MTTTADRRGCNEKSKAVICKAMAKVFGDGVIPHRLTNDQYHRIQTKCQKWYKTTKLEFPTKECFEKRLDDTSYRCLIGKFSESEKEKTEQRHLEAALKKERKQDDEVICLGQKENMSLNARVLGKRKSSMISTTSRASSTTWTSSNGDNNAEIEQVKNENVQLKALILSFQNKVTNLENKGSNQAEKLIKLKASLDKTTTERNMFRSQVERLQAKDKQQATKLLSVQETLRQSQFDCEKLKTKAEDLQLHNDVKFLQVTTELSQIRKHASLLTKQFEEEKKRLEEIIRVKESELEDTKLKMKRMQEMIAHAPTFLGITWKEGFKAADPESKRMIEVSQQIEHKKRKIGAQYSTVKACLNKGSFDDLL